MVDKELALSTVGQRDVIWRSESMVVSEERMAALETRTERLEQRMRRLDAQLAGAGAQLHAPRPDNPRIAASVAPPVEPRRVAPCAADAGAAAAPRERAGSGGRVRARAAAAAPRVEDLVGGRVLGWVGGLATLVGLLFLLVIAASRGWIGEEARVLMAAATSLALLAAGAWLHERRGRNEAALAAAATGIAGLFAATVVAGPVYELLPASGALVLALAVGAAATGLALRWAAPGIGWLGITGALLSPALVGAAGDGTGIALMLVAYAAAAAIMIWQRWHALAGVAFAIAVPQLAWWIIETPPAAAVIAGLSVF
jgi:uncharacterized membrane protein